MGSPSLTEPGVPPEGDSGDTAIQIGLEVARAALAKVGAERVEVVTRTGWVTIQPTRLEDGESIARALGLDSPMDHRMTLPGYTLWSGVLDGLEVQVRGALRQPTGGLQ